MCYKAIFQQPAYRTSKQYLCICLCNGPKTGKADDVTSLERKFYHLQLSYDKISGIFGILRQSEQGGYVYEKIWTLLI